MVYGQMEMLRSLEADVVCLQEAKNWHADGEEMLHDTAEALTMEPRMALSRSHGCHLVTLVRTPGVRIRRFYPDIAERNFHHTVSRAVLQVEGVEQELQLLHTHLDPFSGADRLNEVGWLTEYTDRPTILVGDLNIAGPDDLEPKDWNRIPPRLQSRHRFMREDATYGGLDRRAVHALLHAGYLDPPAHLGIEAEPTAGYWDEPGSERWEHRSDYVLPALPLADALTGYQVPDTPGNRELADHLPVVATFTIGP